MSTIEAIRAIVKVDPRSTTADVARILNISRQRVSKLCTTNGLKLHRNYVERSRIPRLPTPRIITGGAMVEITSTPAAVICELLVAADLIARGYKPYSPFVRQRSHDILAVNKAGDVITIEVRSGRRSASGNVTWKSHERDQSQYFAIVCTGEPVSYSPDLPSP